MAILSQVLSEKLTALRAMAAREQKMSRIARIAEVGEEIEDIISGLCEIEGKMEALKNRGEAAITRVNSLVEEKFQTTLASKPVLPPLPELKAIRSTKPRVDRKNREDVKEAILLVLSEAKQPMTPEAISRMIAKLGCQEKAQVVYNAITNLRKGNKIIRHGEKGKPVYTM